MKTERHDDHMIRRYDSWGEWCDMIDARPNNPSAGLEGEFTSSLDNSEAFSGGWDYRETARRLRQGWKEGTARIVQGLESLHATEQDAAPCPHQFEHDIAGAFPDVSAYCAGEPEHMLTPAWTDPQASPTFAVYIQPAACSLVKADHLERYGIAALSIIDATARAGLSVEVWAAIHMFSRHDSSTWTTLVPLTLAGTVIDRDRLAAAMHPGFFRRAYFAHTETHADHMESVGGGYGRPTPLSPETARLNGPGLLLPMAGTMPDHLTTPGKAAEWVRENAKEITTCR